MKAGTSLDATRKGILRRRVLLEAIADQRKHLLHIEHTLHRSLTSVAVNLVAGLIAYCHQLAKSSIERGG